MTRSHSLFNNPAVHERSSNLQNGIILPPLRDVPQARPVLPPVSNLDRRERPMFEHRQNSVEMMDTDSYTCSTTMEDGNSSRTTPCTPPEYSLMTHPAASNTSGRTVRAESGRRASRSSASATEIKNRRTKKERGKSTEIHAALEDIITNMTGQPPESTQSVNNARTSGLQGHKTEVMHIALYILERVLVSIRLAARVEGKEEECNDMFRRWLADARSSLSDERGLPTWSIMYGGEDCRMMDAEDAKTAPADKKNACLVHQYPQDIAASKDEGGQPDARICRMNRRSTNISARLSDVNVSLDRQASTPFSYTLSISSQL